MSSISKLAKMFLSVLLNMLGNILHSNAKAVTCNTKFPNYVAM